MKSIAYTFSSTVKIDIYKDLNIYRLNHITKKGRTRVTVGASFYRCSVAQS